ncbi:hypothetical protein [Streptococcus cuniculi]|uniref:hypothetical protein n=1 Tax=Streptococcus cuniculi TaxID=1432788 RepID=UPI000ACB4DC0|nr:hypothetical protein [Streptococcus cuniculi]
MVYQEALLLAGLFLGNKGARERKIQLAFRVLCSASCGQQATPQLVFEAEAINMRM